MEANAITLLEEELRSLEHTLTTLNNQATSETYQETLKRFAMLWHQLKIKRGKDQFLTIVQADEDSSDKI